MTSLYILNISHLDWQKLLPQLPPDRQKKAQTLRKEADKARSVGAGMLLQYALEQAGVPKAQQIFDRTHLGKPFLKHIPEMHFSLSHSGDYVVCAVSHAPVGVDVELPRCTMEIAGRFFHEDELPGTEDKDFLLRLWTAKESFVKALGGGLTIPLNSFLVRLSAQEARLEQTLSPLPYKLREFVLGEHRVCLCTAEPSHEPVFVSPDTLC